jgi:hypothetical protein
MAVTDYSIAPVAGVNFNRRTTAKEFALGTVVHGTANTIWIYVQASENVATGTCTVTGTTLTDTGGNFTADTAFLSGEYGWVRRTTATVA